MFISWNDVIYLGGQRSICNSQIFALRKGREKWKWVPTTLSTDAGFSALWLGQSLSEGKKKTNNRGICSSELVKIMKTVERLLSDQSALCVLVISWAGLGCISRSAYTGFRTKFRNLQLAFRERSKLKDVYCFKAKDIILHLKARNQHFIPNF